MKKMLFFKIVVFALVCVFSSDIFSMEGDKKAKEIETNDTLEKALQSYNQRLITDINHHNLMVDCVLSLNENNTWKENGTDRFSVYLFLNERQRKLEEDKRISNKIMAFLGAQKNQRIQPQYPPLSGVLPLNQVPPVGTPVLQVKPAAHLASSQQNYQSIVYVPTQIPQNNSNAPQQGENNKDDSLDIFHSSEDTNK